MLYRCKAKCFLGRLYEKGDIAEYSDAIANSINFEKIDTEAKPNNKIVEELKDQLSSSDSEVADVIKTLKSKKK